MTKKHIVLMIVSFILGFAIGGTILFFITNNQSSTNANNITNSTTANNSTNNVVNSNTEFKENGNENNELNLPTVGNDTVIKTNSKTTLRVVNEYDTSFFKSKKNLLIMFASWCPNCQEEISEIEKILNHYKNNKNVNIVLIAHEYSDTVKDLISLVENDVDFGNVEIKIDLGRVIRKNIDPEASTIPISYVVDKSGKVLSVWDDSLTLQQAIEMIEK